MIWLNFEKWSTGGRRIFTWKRIYWKGYKWTPFCIIRIRYRPWYKSLLKPKYIVKLRRKSIINQRPSQD